MGTSCIAMAALSKKRGPGVNSGMKARSSRGNEALTLFRTPHSALTVRLLLPQRRQQRRKGQTRQIICQGNLLDIQNYHRDAKHEQSTHSINRVEQLVRAQERREEL